MVVRFAAGKAAWAWRMARMEEIIERLVRESIDDAQVEASGAGDRFHVRVSSPAFAGLSRVRRQQLVYEAIGHLIRDGALHAVTIETAVPDRA